jgi:hypothetical protein
MHLADAPLGGERWRIVPSGLDHSNASDRHVAYRVDCICLESVSPGLLARSRGVA